MVCLPFELRNWETAADSRAYTPVMYVNRSLNQTEFRSQPRSRLTTAECQRLGDNTVSFRLLATGTPTLRICTNVTKDADSDCSGIIAGTLLLFTFTKKASTVVNFDVENYCIFSLAWQMSFLTPPRHLGHGIVSSNEGTNG